MKLAYLAVLWFFVVAAFGVVRSDLLGDRGRKRGGGRSGRAARQKAPKQPKQSKKKEAPAPSRRAVPRQLVVVQGPLTGTTIGLASQEITIGRAHHHTLVLSDDYASTNHARLYSGADGQWFIEDTRSTNGTYLGRQKLMAQQPEPVPIGEPIRIGKTVMELRK
nr:FHA domain-containing protein [Allonocardiopsis opalescens]